MDTTGTLQLFIHDDPALLKRCINASKEGPQELRFTIGVLAHQAYMGIYHLEFMRTVLVQSILSKLDPQAWNLDWSGAQNAFHNSIAASNIDFIRHYNLELEEEVENRPLSFLNESLRQPVKSVLSEFIPAHYGPRY
jgi:hypothetical protein